MAQSSLLDSLPRNVTVAPEQERLFRHIEDKFRSTGLGTERWYIVLLVCIVAGPDPEVASQLYMHLIARPEYETPAARQRLVRRLREALVKLVSILGVCKPLEAILAIAPLEQEQDKDYSTTRSGWTCDEASRARGRAWIERVYTRNAGDTAPLFAAHRDFAWISAHITYGLYLSDRQVLDDVETQMVVLPGIMMQNLPLETHWHIRGTRRIGVSKEDVQVVWDSVKLIASYFGLSLRKVPTVDDVEPDV
jgi:hypothetical protein